MNVPENLFYTKEHEWIKIEGNLATVGITDYAQGSLGDITFVELPNIGKVCEQFKQLATIESVKAASVKGVVFGLSGGIDSAVVSVLCKRAFPRDCLGVIMPCHSVGEDQRHAEMVAKKFDIPCRAIELGNVFDALSRALGNEIWGAGHRGTTLIQ